MKREVASLTKMMTFYTALKLLLKWQMHPKNVNILINYNAAGTQGTTAHLKEGDVLSLE